MKHPILYANVRELMRRLGEDQEAFADRMGVTQGSVSRWGDPSVPRGTVLTDLAALAGVSPKSLLTEKLPERERGTRQVRVIGFVGAGEAVYAFENLGFNEEQPTVDLPAEIPGNAALTVKGDSIYPTAEDGWSIVYIGGKTTDSKDIVGHLCVVQLEDGRMLVKKVEKGLKRGTYTLLSSNAPAIENVPLSWAARVQAIVPR